MYPQGSKLVEEVFLKILIDQVSKEILERRCHKKKSSVSENIFLETPLIMIFFGVTNKILSMKLPT